MARSLPWRWLAAALLLAGLAAAGVARGQEVVRREATQQWLKGLERFQAGEALERTQESAAALAAYREALAQFETVRTGFPTWNPAVIDLRLARCRARIAALAPPGEPPVPPPRAPDAPDLPAAVAPAPAVRPRLDSDGHALIESLVRENRQLRRETLALRDQLKDAAPPTAGHPLQAQLERTLAVLADERRRAEARQQELAAANATQQRTLAECRDQLRELSLKLLESQRQGLAHATAMERLKGEVQNAKDAAKRAQEQAAAQERADQALQARLKAAAADHARLTALLDQLAKAEPTAAKQALAAQEARLAAVQEQLLKDQAAGREVAAKLKTTTEDLDVLQAANRELRRQLDQAADRVTEALVRELESTLETVRVQWVEREEAYERLQRKYADQLEIGRGLRANVVQAGATPADPDGAARRRELAVLKADGERAAARGQQLQIELDAARDRAAADRQVFAELLAKYQAVKTELEQRESVPAPAAGGAAARRELDTLLPRARAAAASVTGAAAATELYEQALALDPRQAEALRWLARRYADSGDLERAEDRGRRALAAGPGDRDVLLALAAVLQRAGKPRAAVGLLGEPAAAAPRDAGLQRVLGEALAAAGWPAAAGTQLTLAWDLDPTAAATALALARWHATATPPRVQLGEQWYSKARQLGAEREAALERLLAPTPSPRAP